MPKSRMSATDVAAEASCLRRRVLGMRLANVYDLNAAGSKLMFKFARSGEDGEKCHVIMESGLRFHTSSSLPEKAALPTGFCSKLRKHIRTRRLEDVRQLGVDRIVDFTFGQGEGQHHIILELYSAGNIILTDASYNILTLLRNHRDDDKGYAIMANHPYPMQVTRLRTRIDLEGLRAVLQAGDDHPKGNLRSILARSIQYGPAVAEHCALTAGLDPFMPPADAAALSEPQVAALHDAIAGFQRWVDDCDSEPPCGYISLKPQAKGAARKPAAPAASAAAQVSSAPEGGATTGSEGRPEPVGAGTSAGAHPMGSTAEGQGAGGGADAADAVYEDYEPLVLAQHSDRERVAFATFDAAVEEFYAKIEGQRVDQKLAARDKLTLQKLERVRQDHATRVGALRAVAGAAESQAAIIEANVDAVDAVIDAVNATLATGMDWTDIGVMIKEEAAAGNPVAKLVKKLDLAGGRVTVSLRDPDAEEGAPPVGVVVDLDRNAFQNASSLHTVKKKNLVKESKTLDSNQHALKAAERRVAATLATAQVVTQIQHVRKTLWFEKFHWFISSQNYLVLSGHDMQQNELLVKRYMRRGDLYVHAEVHGAATTIIKNPAPDEPVHPGTLHEAGQACMCRSKAWDNKIVSSAWWVHHDQVSKAAPTGEYLPTGSFMIRGRKNFLPPSPLIMGLGFVFKLDDESLARHVGERAAKVAAEAWEAGGGECGPAAPGASTDGRGDSAPDASTGAGGEDLEEGASGLGDEGGSSASGASQASGSSDGGEEGQAADTPPAAPSPFEAGDAKLDSGTLFPQGERGNVPATAAVAAGSRASSALEAFMEGSGPVVDRYGLQEEGDEHQTHLQLPEEMGGLRLGEQGKSRLSARQRKVLKKRGQGGGAAAPDAVQEVIQEAASSARANGGDAAPPGEGGAEASLEAARAAEAARVAAKAAAAAQAADAAAARSVRGRKGKAKKVAAKYADQDEEERTAMMAVLASGGAQQNKQQRKALRKERGAAKKAAVDTVPVLGAEAQLQAIEAATGKAAPAHLKPQPPPDVAGSDGRQGGGAAGPGGAPNVERRERRLAKKMEQAEIDALLAEENIMHMSEEDKEKLTVVDSLTGAPKPEDGLLYALPVCAPYGTLSGYKFKVKLIPGAQKKGKAARQAVDLLSRMVPETSSRERDLIKAVTEPELTAALVGGVRMSLPGMAAVKQRDKRAKKGRRA